MNFYRQKRSYAFKAAVIALIVAFLCDQTAFGAAARCLDQQSVRSLLPESSFAPSAGSVLYGRIDENTPISGLEAIPLDEDFKERASLRYFIIYIGQVISAYGGKMSAGKLENIPNPHVPEQHFKRIHWSRFSKKGRIFTIPFVMRRSGDVYTLRYDFNDQDNVTVSVEKYTPRGAKISEKSEARGKDPENARKDRAAMIMEEMLALIEDHDALEKTPERPFLVVDIGGTRKLIYGNRARPVFYLPSKQKYVEVDLLENTRVYRLFSAFLSLLKGDEVEVVLPFSFDPSPKPDSAWDSWHNGGFWQFVGMDDPYSQEIDPLVIGAVKKALRRVMADTGKKDLVLLDIFAGAGRMIESLDRQLRGWEDDVTGQKPSLKYFLIDRNKNNTDHATSRLKGLGATVLNRDLSKIEDIEQEIGAKPHIVTCEGGLTYEVAEKEDALAISRKVYQALEPGGVFIVTGYNPVLVTAEEFTEMGFRVVNMSTPGNILNYSITPQLYVLVKRTEAQTRTITRSADRVRGRLAAGLILLGTFLAAAIFSATDSVLGAGIAGAVISEALVLGAFSGTVTAAATRFFDLDSITASLEEVKDNFDGINVQLNSLRDDLDGLMISNLIEGYDLLNRILAENRDITPRDLLELNGIVHYGHDYRLRYEYNDVLEATKNKFLRYQRPLFKWYERHKNDSPFKRAAGVYVRILSMPQLFIEGNHRTGAMAASFILLRAGLPPFVLNVDNAVEYFNVSTDIKFTGDTATSHFKRLLKGEWKTARKVFEDLLRRRGDETYAAETDYRAGAGERIRQAEQEIRKALDNGVRLRVEVTAVEKHLSTSDPSGFRVSYKGIEGFVHRKNTGLDFRVPINELEDLVGLKVELPVISVTGQGENLAVQFSMLERHTVRPQIIKEDEDIEYRTGNRREKVPRRQRKNSKVNRLSLQNLKRRQQETLAELEVKNALKIDEKEPAEGREEKTEPGHHHLPDGSPLEMFRLLSQAGEYLFPEQIRERTRGKMQDEHLSIGTVLRDLGTLVYLGLAHKFGEGEDAVYSAVRLNAPENSFAEAVLKTLGTRPSSELKKRAAENMRGIMEITGDFDTRPYEAGLLHPAYIEDSTEIKAIVNPESAPITVLYGGAGTDISTFLLSTNAVNGYFVSHNEDLQAFTIPDLEKYKMLENEQAAKDLRDNDTLDYHRKFTLGFSPAWSIITTEERVSALAIELYAIGASDIAVDDHDGSPRIKFKWAYHGESAKERAITFIEADITDVGSYPPILERVLSEGIDIYYQRAGLRIPGAYIDAGGFIGHIHGHMRRGGAFVTDDHSFKERDNKSRAVYIDRSGDFPLSIPATVVPGRALRSGIISRVRERMPSQSYGWELNLRMLGDPAGTADRTTPAYGTELSFRERLQRDDDNWAMGGMDRSGPVTPRRQTRRVKSAGELEPGQIVSFRRRNSLTGKTIYKGKAKVVSIDRENDEVALTPRARYLHHTIYSHFNIKDGVVKDVIRTAIDRGEWEQPEQGASRKSTLEEQYRLDDANWFMGGLERMPGPFEYRLRESLEEIIRYHFKGKKSVKGFDLGASTGWITEDIWSMLSDLFREVDFVGIENEPVAVEEAEEDDTPVIYGDVRELPGVLDGEKVDLVTMINPDPTTLEDFVTTAKRIVSDDGLVVINLAGQDMRDLMKGNKVFGVEAWKIKEILSGFKLVEIGSARTDMLSYIKKYPSLHENIFLQPFLFVYDASRESQADRDLPAERPADLSAEQQIEGDDNDKYPITGGVYIPPAGHAKLSGSGKTSGRSEYIKELDRLRMRKEKIKEIQKTNLIDDPRHIEERAIPYLQRMMSDSDSQVSRKAREMLRRIKNRASPENSFAHMEAYTGKTVHFKDIIKDNFRDNKKISGLDFGAGTGEKTKWMEILLEGEFDKVEFSGVEKAEEFIEIAKRRGNNVAGNGVAGLADGRYSGTQDIITIFYPYAEDLELFVEVAKDLVKEGGLIAISFQPDDLEALLGGGTLYGGIRHEDAIRHLQGFSMVRVHGARTDTGIDVFTEQENIFVFKKQEEIKTLETPPAKSDNRQQRFIDSVIMLIEKRAIETGYPGQDLIVGLDISWIPDEQKSMTGMWSLLRSIEGLSKSRIKGFRKIKILIEDDPAALASRVTAVLDENKSRGIHTPLSNIVLIGEKQVMDSGVFRGFRPMSDERGAIFARVELPGDMGVGTDIDILSLTAEVLEKVSRIGSGRDIYVKLPEAGKFPVYELAEIYRIRSEALIRL